MIHDIRPYPDVQSARVAWIYAHMVTKYGKQIKVGTESATERKTRIEGYWVYDGEQYKKYGYYDA